VVLALANAEEEEEGVDVVGVEPVVEEPLLCGARGRRTGRFDMVVPC
jgi:hypothetical protein